MIPLGVLASARVAAGGVDPLAGIPFEWRFESASITGLSDGATVTTWSDTSGNGRHATQATEANRPTWTPAAFGGAGGVTVGRTQWLRTATITTVAQPTVFYFVGSFGSTYYCWAFDGATMSVRQWAGAAASNTILMGAPTERYASHTVGTPAVRVFRFASGAGTVHTNGGAGLSMSNAIGTAGVNGLTVGNNPNGDGGLGATIGALLVGAGHTIAQMNTVGNYLATTYGFTWTEITL